MNDTLRAEILTSTEAGQKISKAWDVPYETYLKNELSGIPPLDTDNRYCQIVVDEMTHGHSVYDARQLRGEFEKLPAIQMADGSIVMTNREVFLNNFGADIAVRSHNARTLFNQQCSTITNITNTAQKVGPAFVEWQGAKGKVFDSSGVRLRQSTPQTLRDIKVSFDGVDVPAALEAFRGREFATGALAITAMNQVLWPFETKVAYYDESLSARVVARAIEATDLGDELVDRPRRQALLARRAVEIVHPSNFILRDTTDFFYGVKDEKMQPLYMKGEYLRARTDDSIVAILSKTDLVEKLRNGELYPDLSLTYATMCLKSGIAAMGGLSQQEYLPQIASMFGFNPNDGRWASKLTAGLIGPSKDIDSTIAGVLRGSSSIHDLQRQLSDKTIGELIGPDMPNLAYYEKLLPRRSL